jgi:hypothetical protein
MLKTDGGRAQWRPAEEGIYKRGLTNGPESVGNRHLSERQIVKLGGENRSAKIMLCGGAGRDLGWDAKDEQRAAVQLWSREPEEMSLRLSIVSLPSCGTEVQHLAMQVADGVWLVARCVARTARGAWWTTFRRSI